MVYRLGHLADAAEHFLASSTLSESIVANVSWNSFLIAVLMETLLVVSLDRSRMGECVLMPRITTVVHKLAATQWSACMVCYLLPVIPVESMRGTPLYNYGMNQLDILNSRIVIFPNLSTMATITETTRTEPTVLTYKQVPETKFERA